MGKRSARPFSLRACGVRGWFLNLTMADEASIGPKVLEVKRWTRWSANAASPSLIALSKRSRWIHQYFQRMSSVRNARHYFGESIRQIWVPRHRPDLPPHVSVIKGIVDRHFKMNETRHVYIAHNAETIIWASCGKEDDEGKISHGCPRGCASSMTCEMSEISSYI